MPVEIEVRVTGLEETEEELTRIITDLNGAPFERAMMDAAILVSGDAKRNLVGYMSPRVGGVDTGRLRASITPVVRGYGDETVGIVGSNVQYAPHVELGTKPHWPPFDKLRAWARRHGAGGGVTRSVRTGRFVSTINVYVIARAIARRGTYAKRFLQKAFDSNKRKIYQMLDDAVGRIIE